mmetsp:Transcript_79288/g.208251  ORF Transcript_79288/g.208251 Transcript_79288/m.208251 type:complete len:202 (-) Transcript_79288:318-923(-)
MHTVDSAEGALAIRLLLNDLVSEGAHDPHAFLLEVLLVLQQSATFLLELLLVLLQSLDLVLQDLHVDAGGLAPHLHAPLDEVADVDLVALEPLRDHLEEKWRVLDVEPEDLQLRAELALLDLLCELRHAHRAALVHVEHLQDFAQVLKLGDVLVAQLQRLRVPVGLRVRHRPLDEDARENVEQGELTERDEEEKDAGVHEA